MTDPYGVWSGTDAEGCGDGRAGVGTPGDGLVAVGGLVSSSPHRMEPSLIAKTG